MAIDTEAKRRSVQAYTLGLIRPPADSAVNEADRATVTWLYAGLDYESPPVSTHEFRITGGYQYA